MPSYMLLLYDNPAQFRDLSAEELQRIIQKYRAWGNSLRESGRLIGSHKLKDDAGRVLRAEGGKPRVLDGPFSETKEIIGGYFMIQAADYQEALQVAESCPHLAYGTIYIREIDLV